MNKVRDMFSQRPTSASDCIKEESLFVIAIWYSCRTLGLLPLTIRRVTAEGRQRVWMASYSTIWMVYSWIVILSLGAGSLYGIHLLILFSPDGSHKPPSIAVQLADCSHALILLITGLVGCASCRRHAKDLIRAKLLIEKVESTLSWSQVQRLTDWKFIIVIVIQLIVTAAVLTADIYDMFVVAHDNLSLPIVFICNHLMYVISCLMMMRIVNTLYPLKTAFIYVSDVTRTINNHLQANPDKGNAGVLYMKISSVIDGRMLTSKAAAILNHDQSSSSFIMILLIIYRSVFYLTVVINNKMSVLDISICIIYVCCEIVKLVSLVETCYQVSEESHKWIVIGAEMLSNVQDVDLRNDINFSIKSASYEPLRFMAFGIFIVNRELLSMVGGVIISTVLILVQVT